MSADVNFVLLLLDLAGVFLFGIEGADYAIDGHLDVLGIMVLAFTTALGGGIIRDLLLGDTPPATLRDWRYPAAAFAGGVVAFSIYWFDRESIPDNVIVVLDAAALSLFVVAGTVKALLFRIHPFLAPLLGTITGCGGGTMRDILLATVPMVLRTDIYATAALAGAVTLVLARACKVPARVAAALGGLVCFTLRIVAVHLHWNLPVAE